MDIDTNKIVASPFAAGILGALAGLKFAPGISWLERVTNVVTGSACAGFAAPAAGEMFRLTSPSMLGFLAFAVGMFGMSIAAAVMQGIRDLKLGEIIDGYLRRRSDKP